MALRGTRRRSTGSGASNGSWPSRGGVTLIDSYRVLAGPNGEYLGFVPDPDGQPVPVRRADGVHLHDAGRRSWRRRSLALWRPS